MFSRPSRKINKVIKKQNKDNIVHFPQIKPNKEEPKLSVTPPAMQVINPPKFNKVFVIPVHGTKDYGVVKLFKEHKYLLVNDIDNADIVVFTGGSDVNPILYGQAPHYSTRSNPGRDATEQSIFNYGKDKKKLLVGICRGSQFLNVMNGGKLWQNVNNHAVQKGHWATVTSKDPEEIGTEGFYVTSTHHQMIRANKNVPHRVLLEAWEASQKEDDSIKLLQSDIDPSNEEFFTDIESIWYPDTRAFCFQPHPEYDTATKECVEFFFNTIETALHNPKDLM